MAEETDLEKCKFWNFRSPVTFTLTLDRVVWHTIMHQSSTSIYIPNVIEIRKKFYGRTYRRTEVRTDVPTDGRTFPPLMLLGRLRGVDLKIPTALSADSVKNRFDKFGPIKMLYNNSHAEQTETFTLNSFSTYTGNVIKI